MRSYGNHSSCRFQVWVQDLAPACHLATTPKGCFWRKSKFLTSKSKAKLLGQRSSSDRHRFCWPWVRWANRAFPNLLQLLQAVTGLLEEKVLPLLWYWLDSRVKKFSMICKFLAGTTHWQVVTTNFVFHVKWNFWWSSQKLIIKALIASLNFSITYWSLSKNRAKEQIHCYYPHSLGWILSQCAE